MPATRPMPQECLQLCFASTFGMTEYEMLAKSIVEFLAKGVSEHIKKSGYAEGEGWDKQFVIEDVTDDPHLFACFAASGMVKNTYSPKGGFVVSDEFIERLSNNTCSSCKGSRSLRENCTAGRN